MPDRRTFVLSRAGFAGHPALRRQLDGRQYVALGPPVDEHADGAWASASPASRSSAPTSAGSPELATPELFLRWMQYGALTPFCRNHCDAGNIDQYAWAFGGVMEELCREALRLRYRLMPYIYAAFMRRRRPARRCSGRSSSSSRTTWRRDIDDEYLLGHDLLVAPVVGGGDRPPGLPAGGTGITGIPARRCGRSSCAPRPDGYIPLYAAGARSIPLWPEAPPPRRATTRVHRLHVFVPDADGEYHSLLHEDDGLTFDNPRRSPSPRPRHP